MNKAADGIEMQGLSGSMLRWLRGWRGERGAQRRQMHLVETLPLGGKRQLMLVKCGGEHFLVGGGPESVETIVRVKVDSIAGEKDQTRDEICQ